MPHVPELAWGQFEPDKEKHQHDAEFREMLQVLRVGQEAENRADDDPGDEVTKNRPHAEAHGQRNRDNRGGQINQGIEQKTFHRSFRQIGSWASASGRSITIRLRAGQRRDAAA